MVCKRLVTSMLIAALGVWATPARANTPQPQKTGDAVVKQVSKAFGLPATELTAQQGGIDERFPAAHADILGVVRAALKSGFEATIRPIEENNISGGKKGVSGVVVDFSKNGVRSGELLATTKTNKDGSKIHELQLTGVVKPAAAKGSQHKSDISRSKSSVRRTESNPAQRRKRPIVNRTSRDKLTLKVHKDNNGVSSVEATTRFHARRPNVTQSGLQGHCAVTPLSIGDMSPKSLSSLMYGSKFGWGHHERLFPTHKNEGVRIEATQFRNSLFRIKSPSNFHDLGRGARMNKVEVNHNVGPHAH